MAKTTPKTTTPAVVSALQPIAIKAVNGHGWVTSLQVAQYFGKRHDAVLRDIREICSADEGGLHSTVESDQCIEDFAGLNYRLSEYKNEQGKPQPMVEMTKDGFTFLAMGFRGSAAKAWKIRFIAAFNRLEQAHIELLEKTASQAIADQEFRQTLSWGQRLDAFDDMHRARADLDREADPAQRVIRWEKLAFVCRALGYTPDPLESMTSPLLLGNSKRQQDDSDKITDLTDMRDHLLRTLCELNTAAEPLLFPVDMEEMPPVVRAARKAISMGLAQKGGAQ